MPNILFDTHFYRGKMQIRITRNDDFSIHSHIDKVAFGFLLFLNNPVCNTLLFAERMSIAALLYLNLNLCTSLERQFSDRNNTLRYTERFKRTTIAKCLTANSCQCFRQRNIPQIRTVPERVILNFSHPFRNHNARQTTTASKRRITNVRHAIR